MMPTGKASGNAVLAKARALYGSRLRADDYRRLMACRTMTELAAALKEYPLYSEALAEVNPQYARRVQLENLLRQSLYTRYDSLCRYDRSAGSKVYEYFTLCCEVDELTAAMRCLDAGRPGDYLFRLPEFLQQRCCIDLYALAKATSLDGILAAVAGTRWEKVLAPLQSAKPDRGLTAQAEPLLQDFRHRALVALAPAKGGTSAAPNLRDLVELECDTSAVSNAARLIRIGAPDSVVRTNARRDCTALTNDEWEYLLAARDLDTFKARFARTKYGPLLGHHEYSVLKEGFFHYRCDWCRKWLRFSTEPTLVMMCYIWLAQCEVWNLNHIIEGDRYSDREDERFGDYGFSKKEFDGEEMVDVEEDEEEDLGWKEEFAPCRSRKLPCYTIGRENVSKKFCIPNVLTALILSGDMGMLEYGFDHYKLENPVVCRGKIEALGEALLYGDETKRTGN